jgi:glycosyltransferase involved in cell wall biosynthesis
MPTADVRTVEWWPVGGDEAAVPAIGPASPVRAPLPVVDEASRAEPGLETLSVVVCTRNRPASLAACVASLARQTRRAAELVIVDAGTLPLPARFRRRLRKRLRGTRVRILVTPPGLPRQRNRGAEITTGSVVVFLDDDVVLEPGYLDAVARVYEDDPGRTIGGVGGAQVPDPTPREGVWRKAFCRLFLQESFGDGRVKRSGRPSYCLSPTERRAVEFLSGCNMSFRREVMTELAFDERLDGYALGEDLDFSYRVSRRWALVLTPEARLDHRHVAGGRPDTDAFRAMSTFNKYLFFRDRVARHPLDWLAYLWAAMGGVAFRIRSPRERGLAGLVRGYGLVLGHACFGTLPPPPTPAPQTRPLPARPFVSVVVPARNEEATLGPCVASILGQERTPAGFEVLVVENGSRDRTRAVAEALARDDPRVRVLASDARNQSEAMNDGILAARGAIVARVDAHSRIAPDYLAQVVAALRRHPGAAGVGGPFLAAGETTIERAVGLARSSPFGVGGGYGVDRDGAEHDVRTVQCGAYWRDALLDAELFDAAMAYGEDEELNWRLVRSGARVVLCPALRQPYRPRGTLGGLLRQYWNYGQGRARVLAKHPDFVRVRHLVPSAFVLCLAVLTVVAMLVPRAAGPLGLAVLAYALVLAASAVRELGRAPAAEVALVPAAVACMHVGYGAGLLVRGLRTAFGGREQAPARDDAAVYEPPAR